MNINHYLRHQDIIHPQVFLHITCKHDTLDLHPGEQLGDGGRTQLSGFAHKDSSRFRLTFTHQGALWAKLLPKNQHIFTLLFNVTQMLQGPLDPTLQRVRSFKRELRRARSFRAARERVGLHSNPHQNGALQSSCPCGTQVFSIFFHDIFRYFLSFSIAFLSRVSPVQVTFLVRWCKAGRAGGPIVFKMYFPLVEYTTCGKFHL